VAELNHFRRSIKVRMALFTHALDPVLQARLAQRINKDNRLRAQLKRLRTMSPVSGIVQI
jgi:hypothetical protein